MAEQKRLTESLKKTYEKMVNDRQPYVDRGIECAKYTIPSLFHDDTNDGNTAYTTPYQSIGSRGVNNLASKLLLAMLPPNEPFFRLSTSAEVNAELEQQPTIRQQVEKELAKIERDIMKYIETHQIRITIAELLKVLVITGNGLLYLPPQGGIKLYKLHNYVVQRDGIGNVIKIITREKIAFSALPDELKAGVAKGKDDVKEDTMIDIFTCVFRATEGDVFYSYQEIEEEVVKGTENQYPVDSTPYIPVRLFKQDGEHYGRSYAEEYLGDLRQVESLSKSLGEFYAICANIILMVNPTGITSIRDLSKAKSGDFIVGRRDDVQALMIDKFADFQTANVGIKEIEGRLSFAFLLNSAVQRQGERVTAEEIRYVAGELEDTLGGVYSILAQELQLPLAKRLLNQQQAIGAMAQLPKGTVEPAITTGLEALGRGHDLNKIDMFLQYLQVLPPQIQQMIKPEGLLSSIANSLGLDTEGIVKTQEELQAEMQQQQQMALEQQVAPQVAEQAMTSGEG